MKFDVIVPRSESKRKDGSNPEDCDTEMSESDPQTRELIKKHQALQEENADLKKQLEES